MKTKSLTMKEVADLVVAAGFVGWRAVEVTAVVWAESGGNAYAVGINDADPTSKAYLSVDLGLCQWNSFWQPQIKPRDALDPERALALMFEKTAGGWANLTLWNAYKSGAHLKYMHDARNALGM